MAKTKKRGKATTTRSARGSRRAASDEPVQMSLRTLARGMAPYNPNEMDAHQQKTLHASIERWGVVQVVVWNKATKTVVGGHQTIRTAQERGDVSKLWAVQVDLPDVREEKALNLALNRIHGEFDWEKVSALLHDIRELDDGALLDLTGFPDYEYGPLLEAEWTPPAEDGSGTPPRDRVAAMITLNAEQAAAFGAALEALRRRERDDALSKAEAVATISREWVRER